MISIQKEIMLLRKMNHPNIIKLYEVYEDEAYVHLVLEYLKGGELFKYLQNKGLYSEKDASLAIRLLLEALDYCHSINIVHRDLKPENLILRYNILINYNRDVNDNTSLKIADFGLATIINPAIPENLRCGTAGYVAPEVLNKLGYGTKADIFSAGIILCFMYNSRKQFCID